MSTRASFTSVTLRDVAGRSGVSITTVSRILNGRESGVPIRDETKQRVLAVAAELGYKPNLLARGLRGSRSSLIGVIARDVSDPFHIQVLQGINEVTRARDYRLFLGHVDYRPDVALTYGSMFERSHADGILDPRRPRRRRRGPGRPDRPAPLRRRRVATGRSGSRSRASTPTVAPGRASRSTTCGSSAIAGSSACSIRGPRTSASARSCTRTYLTERGSSGSIGAYPVSQPDPGPSYRLGRELLAERDRADAATAIFATSDTIAIGLLQAAYQAGVVVPDHLSIVGFDDLDIAAFTIPPLTTVSQSGAEMGRTAATLLLDMIDHDRVAAEIDDIVLAPTLVVRESTAAPHGGPD